MVVLLDVDGVLLDNDRYDAEWARLGEPAFVPLLGGRGDAWAEAQDVAWRRVYKRSTAELRSLTGDARPSPADWWARAIGAEPGKVIVVDDLDGPLAAAREVGARTVRVGAGRAGEQDLVVESLAHLPAQMDQQDPRPLLKRGSPMRVP